MSRTIDPCGKYDIFPFDQDFADAFLGPSDVFLISCGSKPELELTHRDYVKLPTALFFTNGQETLWHRTHKYH